jgi:phosphoglycerate dehydrogenase-like enzyme
MYSTEGSAGGSGALKVVVLGSVGNEIRNEIEDSCRDAKIQLVYFESASESDLLGCEVMFLGFGARGKLNEAIAKCKGIRMIQTQSAGVDYLNFSEIPETILVCTNAGAFAKPMAEHVFAMILALAKNLKKNEIAMRNGGFQRNEVSRELRGKILGIYGYGGIGREVAKIGRALGMQIHAISRNPKSEPRPDWHGMPADLDRLLTVSDVVVISTPLNRETVHKFNSERLSVMKEDAILINVARGEIIVERDLFEHLKKNKKFSAGIDTWWDEPRGDEAFRPRYDFLSLPNVIGSPHNSGNVEGQVDYAVRVAFENILRYARHEEPLNRVNRSDYIP